MNATSQTNREFGQQSVLSMIITVRRQS